MVSQKIKQIMKMKKITNIQVAEHLEMLQQKFDNQESQGWL